MSAARRRAAGLLAAWLGAAAVWAAPAEQADPDPGLLERMRRGFEIAPESETETRALLAVLAERLPADPAADPPVLQAYRAALEGLLGKHGRLPWDKYKRTKAGLAKLDALVAAHPDSIEIRALRFSFCHQLPEFFGKGPQAAADLAVLADQFARGEDPAVAGTYRRDLIRWLLQRGNPAPGDRRKLETALGAPE